MSTTRSISEVPYTIVGGTRVQQSGTRGSGISAVVLDRGSRTLRADALESIVQAGADEVITILGPTPHYDVEQLASRINAARFVLLGHDVTPGEQVNIGIHEALRPHVMVLWSDCDVSPLNDRILQRIGETGAVCVVPVVRNERGAIVPTVSAPAFYGSLFRTVPTQPARHGADCLYPFAYMGLYDRERFLGIGEFDREIVNPYWQLLDFGMRAFLWGERIVVGQNLRITATRPLPPDDATPDINYARFHLKNLAVKFAGDSGRLPWSAAVKMIAGSGLGPVSAVREFRRVRSWVRANRYRFKQDARRLTELWEVGT